METKESLVVFIAHCLKYKTEDLAHLNRIQVNYKEESNKTLKSTKTS